MLQHVVMLRLLDDTPAGHILSFREKMLALPSVIPQIGKLSVGLDEVGDQRSWDVVLVMEFATLEDLQRYQAHPAHQEVMKFNAPWVVAVATVDYHN